MHLAGASVSYGHFSSFHRMFQCNTNVTCLQKQVPKEVNKMLLFEEITNLQGWESSADSRKSVDFRSVGAVFEIDVNPGTFFQGG